MMVIACRKKARRAHGHIGGDILEEVWAACHKYLNPKTNVRWSPGSVPRGSNDSLEASGEISSCAFWLMGSFRTVFAVSPTGALIG
jgi:hypothetical protein